MKKKIQLAFILLVATAAFSQEHRYCQLETCPNRSHTLCAYSVDDYGRYCKDPYNSRITKYDEKMEIVNMHNVMNNWSDLRNAAPPYDLEWDNELADIAQRWAFQCPTAADGCRNIDRFNVTQRFAVLDAYFDYQNEPSVDKAIMSWHMTETGATPSFYHVSFGEATLTGKTGRAWGNANRVGCGKVRDFRSPKIILHLVCNYGYEQTI